MYLMNVFLVDAPTTMSVMALLVAYSIIALEMSLLSKMTSFRCICDLQMALKYFLYSNSIPFGYFSSSRIERLLF